MHSLTGVTRKTAFVIAALFIPGGFIALAGAWLFKVVSQTERGRKVIDLARRRVPAWAASLGVVSREAA